MKVLLALTASAALLFAQAKQPQPKSQKEVDAIMAIFNATDADTRIAASNDLLQKFADTEFKAVAFLVLTQSYEQKNDFEKTVFFGEETLKHDPKSYQAMIILGSAYAKRTKEFDLDKEEKLKVAEKYANSALDLLKTAEKPNPQVTDEQWAAAKKDFASAAQEALAIASLVRKDYDKAIAQFKSAIEVAATPEPAAMVRLSQTYNLAKKYDDAIAIADKVMALPDVHPQIKQAAQAERVRAFQSRPKPAAPAAAPAEAAKP